MSSDPLTTAMSMLDELQKQNAELTREVSRREQNDLAFRARIQGLSDDLTTTKLQLEKKEALLDSAEELSRLGRNLAFSVYENLGSKFPKYLPWTSMLTLADNSDWFASLFLGKEMFDLVSEMPLLESLKAISGTPWKLRIFDTVAMGVIQDRVASAKKDDSSGLLDQLTLYREQLYSLTTPMPRSLDTATAGLRTLKQNGWLEEQITEQAAVKSAAK